MWSAFHLIGQNIGMSFGHALFFILLVGSLTFYAQDVKLGLLIDFVLSMSIFAWYYAMGWNWSIPIISGFIFLVGLALTLFLVEKATTPGGFN